MNVWNIFSKNCEYVEGATLHQIATHIYQNFPRAVRIIVELCKDNKCIICGELSLNFQGKPSLANHLRFSHKKMTMEYVRDEVMTKTPEEIERMLEQ